MCDSVTGYGRVSSKDFAVDLQMNPSRNVLYCRLLVNDGSSLITSVGQQVTSDFMEHHSTQTVSVYDWQFRSLNKTALL